MKDESVLISLLFQCPQYEFISNFCI